MEESWIEQEVRKARERFENTDVTDPMWETNYEIMVGLEQEMWDDFPA